MPFYVEQRFGMSSGIAGLLYAVGTLGYSVAAPFAGILSSKYFKQSTVILAGFATLFVAWIMLYTSLLISATEAVIVTVLILSRLVAGVGCAVSTVPSMPAMLISVHKKHQCEHSVGIISALWNSS